MRYFVGRQSAALVSGIQQGLHISDDFAFVGGIQFVEKRLHFRFRHARVVEKFFFLGSPYKIIDRHSVQVGEKDQSVGGRAAGG